MNGWKSRTNRRHDLGGIKTNRCWELERPTGRRTIPRLSEIIKSSNGKRLFIEVKCGAEIIPALKKLFTSLNVQPDQAAIISFDGETLFAIKQAFPQFPTYHLRIARFNQLDNQWMPTNNKVAMAKHMGFEGVNFGYHGPVKHRLYRDDLATSKSTDLNLSTFPVLNDEDVARTLIQAKIDGITTDHPDKLRELLNK